MRVVTMNLNRYQWPMKLINECFGIRRYAPQRRRFALQIENIPRLAIQNHLK
jgi:hypothetical protein